MEPIKVEFRTSKYYIENDFEYEGLRCVVIFTQMGHRCGYVGVPKEHPLYGKDYHEVDFDVHGGLTYTQGTDDYPVKSELWWFGFDCIHYMDAADNNLALERFPENEKMIKHRMEMDREYPTGGNIRSLMYAEWECERLAKQIMIGGMNE